jgi:hypothetical protein
LFAQTNVPAQQEKQSKASTATPSQIAVSDPGAPSKRTAAPAAANNGSTKTATKGKKKKLPPPKANMKLSGK